MGSKAQNTMGDLGLATVEIGTEVTGCNLITLSLTSVITAGAILQHTCYGVILVTDKRRFAKTIAG